MARLTLVLWQLAPGCLLLSSTLGATPSSFAFISGTIGGTDAYSPMWLAPSSALQMST